jgi:uncharacterized protein YegP (UPF0339 family)
MITDWARIYRMKITVYQAADGWRWRAKAANGEIVSESGELYENKSYALEAARTVRAW